MAAYDPLAFGRELRAYRLRLGWSASQLSELYAGFVGREDSPPDPTFIYHIERGTTMVSLERRAILASLVGMPLALVGVSQQDTSTTIDIPEYTQSLASYCDKWRTGTIQQEAGAIQVRISHLESASLYAFGKEKKALRELFVFYQILHADVWGGPNPVQACHILSSAIETAKEEKLSMPLVHALTQRPGLAIGRFELTHQREWLQVAVDDYANAAEEERNLSPFYSGLFQMRKGLVDAYIAPDKEAFTKALHTITQGSRQIGSSPDDFRIVARPDAERFMLTRASAYLYSPMGDAKLGLAQLEELDREYPEPRGRRVAHRNCLFAEAYLAIGNYPMAVAYLEAALETASAEQRKGLVQVYTRLKNTSYWNHPDIGRIGVKITQMQYPELFR